MAKKILVLSSGGIDSTTCLALAVKQAGNENVCSVIIHYGQRHSKEIFSAKEVAKYYKVSYYEFNLSDIFKYSSTCSLIDGSETEVVKDTYANQVKTTGKISSYVPFRNGLMLSVCATLAQSLWPHDETDIYLGNHLSDFAYADCSSEFVKYMNAAIEIGTYGYVHFKAPLEHMKKSEVISLGLSLNVPYEKTWSCYNHTNMPCGHCASCLERIAAFEANGVKDPAVYKGEFINE